MELPEARDGALTVASCLDCARHHGLESNIDHSLRACQGSLFLRSHPEFRSCGSCFFCSSASSGIMIHSRSRPVPRTPPSAWLDCSATVDCRGFPPISWVRRHRDLAPAPGHDARPRASRDPLGAHRVGASPVASRARVGWASFAQAAPHPRPQKITTHVTFPLHPQRSLCYNKSVSKARQPRAGEKQCPTKRRKADTPSGVGR
jgi:hypothetical protein